jgi:ABC-type dipeptide/oligopeptide/nickel transport system ATPase component
VNDQRVLTVENLHTCFDTLKGTVRAVNGLSFSVDRGKTLCLVGESGCGKSVAALSIMGLVPEPAGRIAAGRISFEGVDLLALDDAQMQRIRGSRISMIFQEPMTSLNPAFTVGEQIIEVFEAHQGMNKREARSKTV